jgi:HEAT repeat protein
MPLDFDQALQILRENSPLSAEMLASLSAPTREESERFASCFCAISEERRRELVAAMVAHAEDSFEFDYRDLFRCCLSDTDAGVRRQAIEGLWEDERVDLLRLLLVLLTEDPDVAVRAAAATALGRFLYLAEFEFIHERYGQRVQEALACVIANDQEDVEVVRRAVESIAFVNDDDVRRIIGWAYDHDDPRMRISAVFAMGRSAEQVWSETVLLELEDPTPEMRYEAARAAGELQLRRAVPRLSRMALERDRNVQGMAIWALGQIGGKSARDLLERLASGDDEVAAIAAEEALDEINLSEGVLDLMAIDPEETEMISVDLYDPSLEDDDIDDMDMLVEDDIEDDDDWSDEVIDLS